MIIAYDVYVMQELTRACQTANDELQRAQNLIQEVRSHNEWTCKEKDAIDDLMQDCKNLVKRLCEEQYSFLEAVKSVGGELQEAENSVSRLFQSVETWLGKILSIPVVENVVSGIGIIGGNISNVADGITGIAGDIQDIFEDWGENVITTIDPPWINETDWGTPVPIVAPIEDISIEPVISPIIQSHADIVPICKISSDLTSSLGVVSFEDLII